MALRGSALVLSVIGCALTLVGSSCAPSPEASDWEVLFDGSSTDHWRAYRRDGFPEKGWVIEGETLKTVPGGDVVDIVSVKEYGDFELALEWRVPPAGNSGVFVRVTEDQPAAWMSAPEIQILDDELHRDGQRAETAAGSLYDLIAASPKSLRPVGEFNSSRIVMRGTHLEHWLNDIRVLDVDLAGPGFAELVAGSKFKEHPDFGKALRGPVALQHHGEEVWFRNVRIRELSPE